MSSRLHISLVSVVFVSLLSSAFAPHISPQTTIHAAALPPVGIIADRTVQLSLDRWDWDSGVALYGMMVAWKATGDNRYFNFVQSWVDGFIAQGIPPITHPNHATPGLATLMLYEATGQQKYLDVSRQLADFLLQAALRSQEGAFYHYQDQLWVDTLFVTTPFLARFGRDVSAPHYVEEAVNQFQVHVRRLQDPTTGLFYHGWDESEDSHLSGAFWQRGNGWAASAGAELLDLLPEDHPARTAIRDSLVQQMRGLRSLQPASGVWPTVVDHPNFYQETSGAAAIGYAMYRGLIQGWLDPTEFSSMAQKTRSGVLARVAEDGTVQDVSSGTGVASTIEDYNHISHDQVQPWGQGLALLLLTQPLYPSYQVYLPVMSKAPPLFPHLALSNKIWHGAERFVQAYPPETIYPGYAPEKGGPTAQNALANVNAACSDFPDLPDLFGPDAHHRACYEWVAAYLALYHAVRGQRTGSVGDIAWAQHYLDIALDVVTEFVYGSEDSPSGVGYRDTLAGIWQNPLRAVDVTLSANLLRQQGALGPERQARAEEVLSGIMRAWYAEYWQTGQHPTSGIDFTIRTAPEVQAYSLAGRQVVSTRPWTFVWNADKGNSPAEEMAWMGGGVMLASRVLHSELPDAPAIYAAAQHYVDFALTYDRLDPIHSVTIRTLNAETTGGAYGQRKYWIENHGVDQPSLPYMGFTWNFMSTALMASNLGNQQPWPNLVPDSMQWEVLLRSAGETMRAADDTLLVDFTPGQGLGYKLQDFPEWWTPCGQGQAGRQYVQYDGRAGGPSLYVSEIGHPAGLDLLMTGWPLMRIAAHRGDEASYRVWEGRLNRVLDEYIAIPPNPYWARCKTAPYVSSNPGYHWSRMLAVYMIAYLGSNGYQVQPWN